MNTCPVCGAENPTTSIVINNSKRENSDKGITEKDVTFDVDLGGSNLVSVSICDDCYRNNKHLSNP